MVRIAVTVVFVGLCFSALFAQNGHYFLSHYNPGSDKLSYLSYDVDEDKNGILYFANRSGVLQFDGRNWTQIHTNGAVYTLTLSGSGEMYAGGTAGFGQIAYNSQNQTEYRSLSDSLKGAHNVFASVTLGSDIFFMTEKALYKVSDSTASEVVNPTAADGSFVGLYRVGESIYVDTEQGVRKLNGNVLTDAEHFSGQHLVFSEVSPDGKNYLMATEDNLVYLLRDGSILQPIVLKDSAYLAVHLVTNATWINDQMIAIGTLRGGVLFVDLRSGNTQETINYFTGLPDNEVFTLHADSHLGVWIAHDYGFTRAAPFLPFRSYNYYPGLAGNLLCVQSFKGTLYVGTTLGLFALTKQEIIGTETYEVLQTIAEAARKAEPVVTERKKSRRGFLGLGRKKEEPPPPPVSKKKVKKKAPTRRKVQMTRKVVRGVEHSFSQVLGMAGKVDQLLIVGNRLIGGGVSGVFEIKDLVAVPLTPKPVRAVYYSAAMKQLLVSNYDDEIVSFKATSKGWVNGNFPDSLSMYADYFFEDHADNLWICGRDRVVRAGIVEGYIVEAEEIPLPYTSVDETVGLSYSNDVYIAQNGQFYHYQSFKNAFVKYDSLPGPKKYFAASGAFWFHDGHKWRTIDRVKQGELKTEWLALFPDIRFLAQAEAGKSLWVITGTNDLYKFSSEFASADAGSNPLFLKQVRNQEQLLSPTSQLRVDERESALTFEFIQPEFVSLQAVEYHYWVKGLQDNWSDWSTTNNVINFPFLHPGQYTVQVESRDLFGKITKLEDIEVNVVPPYWKRPGFYALEFFVFATLVVISMRMNVATARYRLLSQFLSALTVVLLIQFIQTVIVARLEFQSTPVADFFVQVGIALLVLPVENFLRRRMITASEKKRR